MNLDDQFDLEHLFLQERKCRSCGKVKDLLSDFYLTRRNRANRSAYSYECKECTKKRVRSIRRREREDVYPDW